MPFEYELDKELPTSGNICKTVEDAMEEVQTEIDEGIISGCDLYMEESSYHTSWDWLMPVLKKINLKLNPDTYGAWRMINRPTEYNIEEVYAQVVKFIKQYNDATVNNTKR